MSWDLESDLGPSLKTTSGEPFAVAHHRLREMLPEELQGKLNDSAF